MHAAGVVREVYQAVMKRMKGESMNEIANTIQFQRTIPLVIL